MDYALAVDVWNQIKSTTLTDFKEDFVNLAVRYAEIRVKWLFADTEKQTLIGHDRAVCHNAFISTCDILSRNMEKHGEGSTWRKVLGDDRKRVGDFACYLHCILAISAR